MAKMLYHTPYPLNFDAIGGSSLRPVKMYEAFKAIGYEVVLVSGYSKERKKAIRTVKKQIRAGEKFDFLYSESATIATSLTEPKHFPPHPFLDFSFFRFCEKNGIRTGVFYRDIYWLFPIYKELVGKVLTFVMRRFFRWDLKNYQRSVSRVFLPSLEMADFIPIVHKEKFVPLPPGSPSSPVALGNDGLKLFYVGGLGSHYRLHRLLEAVSEIPEIQLTLCTPKRGWETAKAEYEHLLSDNITIVHASGDELIPYFSEANIGCITVESDDYWNFAVPIKLFDYLGHGLPVLATQDTWAGRFIAENECGWVTAYTKEAIKDKLKDLLKLDWIDSMSSKVSDVCKQNTWETRAHFVASILSNYRHLQSR